MPLIKKYLSLLLLVAVFVLSIKVMYFSNIDPEEIAKLENASIYYADCNIGSKYDRPSVRVKELNSEIYVLKYFVRNTQCHLDKGHKALRHSKFTFNYIIRNKVVKAIAVWRDGEVVYSENEYIGEATSGGVFMFIMSFIGFLYWCFKYKIV